MDEGSDCYGASAADSEQSPDRMGDALSRQGAVPWHHEAVDIRVVEFIVACRDARQTIRISCSSLDHLQRLIDAYDKDFPAKEPVE